MVSQLLKFANILYEAFKLIIICLANVYLILNTNFIIENICSECSNLRRLLFTPITRGTVRESCVHRTSLLVLFQISHTRPCFLVTPHAEFCFDLSIIQLYFLTNNHSAASNLQSRFKLILNLDRCVERQQQKRNSISKTNYSDQKLLTDPLLVTSSHRANKYSRKPNVFFSKLL